MAALDFDEDDYEDEPPPDVWFCNHDVPGGCYPCRTDVNEHAAIEAMTEEERRDYLYDGYSPELFFAPGGPAFLLGL